MILSSSRPFWSSSSSSNNNPYTSTIRQTTIVVAADDEGEKDDSRTTRSKPTKSTMTSSSSSSSSSSARGDKIIVSNEDAPTPSSTDDDDDEDETSTNKGKDSVDEEKNLDVIELDSRAFSQNIGDGNKWLIEFYTPYCSHCINFAPTYIQIAHHYHSKSDKPGIKIAKINGSNERALLSRFNIYGFPTLFLIDGWYVYEYDDIRTKQEIMKFINGGYKSKDPIPFYISPMGPMGQMQGTLISTGLMLSDIFTWSKQTLGFSHIITAMILFGTMFIGCFFIIVILALLWTPKIKTD